MTALGLGAAWAAYTVGIWGYCLVRGYNVTFVQLFKGVWPAGSGNPGDASPGGGSAQT